MMHGPANVKPSSYRTVNTFHLSYKNYQLALYRAKVAVCSEINTKHTNIVWHNVKFLNVKPVGATHNK